MEPKFYNLAELTELLRKRGISPTSQRTEIARLLFAHGDHVSAEEVFGRVNADESFSGRVSKATVYNTLGLFADKGLIRQVIADPTRIFYDPNTEPHHHIYDVDSHTLIDVADNDMKIRGMPVLPEGTRLEGVDIIVRVSRQ
ncbi:MAG: Fur family transcriptional regulator [Acidiferrobacterales bacterium]